MAGYIWKIWKLLFFLDGSNSQKQYTFLFTLVVMSLLIQNLKKKTGVDEHAQLTKHVYSDTSGPHTGLLGNIGSIKPKLNIVDWSPE